MLTEREYYERLKAFDQEWRETEPGEEWNFEALPPGAYEAIVVDARMTDSSTGTIGLLVQFEITKGEYEGRFIWHTFWLTERSFVNVKRDLRMLGYVPESSTDVLQAKKHLMNKRIILHLGQEEYMGEVRNKVRRFSKVDEAARKRELEDDKFQF